jgi:hypothetical protein
VRSTGIGRVTFQERVFGKSIRAIDKYIRAIRAVAKTSRFEVYDLESSKLLFLAKTTNGLPSTALVDSAKFFSTAARICDFFDTEISLNRIPNELDISSVQTLNSIATGKMPTSVRIDTRIAKSATDSQIVAALQGQLSSLRLEHGGLELPLFDSIVKTGPFTLLANVRLVNRHAAYQRWASADLGSPVTMEWEPTEPAVVTGSEAGRKSSPPNE